MIDQQRKIVNRRVKDRHDADPIDIFVYHLWSLPNNGRLRALFTGIASMGLGSSLAGTCGKTWRVECVLLFDPLALFHCLRPIELDCPSSLSTWKSSRSSRSSTALPCLGRTRRVEGLAAPAPKLLDVRSTGWPWPWLVFSHRPIERYAPMNALNEWCVLRYCSVL